MSHILFWVSFFGILQYGRRFHGKEMHSLLRNIRPARVAHYLLLLVAGFGFAVITFHARPAWNWLDISTLFLAGVGFASAWMFAVCVNDLTDEETDAISNRSRPLISGSLSREVMHVAAGISLVLMLLTGALTGVYTCFFLLSFTASYWVYSVPPLRLKRVPILSNFLVGVASLCAFLSGFYLLSPDRTSHALPFSVIVFVLVGFTLAANVKDLKDRTGDLAGGVVTLPVWLGERKARRVIGGMIAFVFLIAPLVFGSILWIPSLIAALLAFAVCVQSKVPERGIFALYFLYAFTVFFLLSFFS